MGKKKLEVLFRVDLTLDDKFKMAKPQVKSLLEDRIKGLKVSSFESFNTTKDITRTEIVSNILSLLNAEESMKDIGAFRMHTEEEKDDGTLAIDKLQDNITICIQAYNDKGKKKSVTEGIGAILENFEKRCMEAKEQYMKTVRENKLLKTSLDTVSKMQSMDISRVSEGLSEAQMSGTASLMESLQKENMILKKKTAEIEEKLKHYEKGTSDSVLVDQIQILEKRAKDLEALTKSENKEWEERFQTLSMTLLEKNDKIKELENSAKGSGKEEVITLKKELAFQQTTAKELKQKNGEQEQELAQLKKSMGIKEDQIKQYTAQLAESLEKNAKLEEQIKFLEKAKEEASSKSVVVSSKVSPIGTSTWIKPNEAGNTLSQSVVVGSSTMELLPPTASPSSQAEEQKKLAIEPTTSSSVVLEPKQPQLSSTYQPAVEDSSIVLAGASGSQAQLSKRVLELQKLIREKDVSLSYLTASESDREEIILKYRDDFEQVDFS